MAKTFSLFVSLLAAAFIFGEVAARGHWLQGKKELAAYEKEMAERPLEALSIARRASALLSDEEKRLYGLAVKHQEKHLRELSLAQAIGRGRGKKVAGSRRGLSCSPKLADCSRLRA